MPSIGTLLGRVRTPENAGIVVAIVISVVGAYAVRVGISDYAPAYLGLVALGVSTPTTLTARDLLGPGVVTAAARVTVACVATFVVYVGLLAALTGGGGDIGTLGAAAAFVATAAATAVAARTLESVTHD